MTYKLKFLPSALKEWKKTAPSIQSQFKKKLKERLITPRHQADQLRGFTDVYKIKLRAVGYRLVYEVSDEEITIFIVAVGKRERGKVYSDLAKRLQK